MGTQKCKRCGEDKDTLEFKVSYFCRKCGGDRYHKAKAELAPLVAAAKENNPEALLAYLAKTREASERSPRYVGCDHINCSICHEDRSVTDYCLSALASYRAAAGYGAKCRICTNKNLKAFYEKRKQFAINLSFCHFQINKTSCYLGARQRKILELIHQKDYRNDKELRDAVARAAPTGKDNSSKIARKTITAMVKRGIIQFENKRFKTPEQLAEYVKQHSLALV